MTSDRKSSANRDNAKKSTGPKSEAGKSVVSQNARTHGLLSRNLIVEGESQEEFSQLLAELADEFQPVGLVEHALVERVGIALWRQRRLVRAESAEVSLNQQSFGSRQTNKVGDVLNLDFTVSRDIKAPADVAGDSDISRLINSRKIWESLRDSGAADEADVFSSLPQGVQKYLLQNYGGDADEIDAAIKAEFGSWKKLFVRYVAHYDSLIEKQRIREVSRLVMQSQALPSQTDLLARYQTALDNDLYKALKALREAQTWRQNKAVLSATPVDPGTE